MPTRKIAGSPRAQNRTAQNRTAQNRTAQNRTAEHRIAEEEISTDRVERHLPLTHLSYHALLALSARPLHGYGVLKEIASLTGFLELETGTLYTAIRRLVDQGLIEAAPRPDSGSDSRRRYYRLTPLGAEVLRAESERLAVLVESARARNAFGLAGERGR